MTSTGSLECILPLLEGVKRRDGFHNALCLAHDNHNPSLDVRHLRENVNRKVHVKCWARCENLGSRDPPIHFQLSREALWREAPLDADISQAETTNCLRNKGAEDE